ncbi:MAG: putative DNA-binding protein [Pseudobutyrivibrio sp.]|nr:putative DNA-binding protein [Pseudobutyrivibrio sp.]
MEDKIKSGYLYDFYGELLTEHQRSVYEMSINDDLSLSEIADTLSVSRQAVHDILKRCDKLLQDYEARLHLVEKFMNIREDVIRINDLTSGNADEATLAEISRLSQLILEEL